MPLSVPAPCVVRSVHEPSVPVVRWRATVYRPPRLTTSSHPAVAAWWASIGCSTSWFTHFEWSVLGNTLPGRRHPGSPATTRSDRAPLRRSRPSLNTRRTGPTILDDRYEPPRPPPDVRGVRPTGVLEHHRRRAHVLRRGTATSVDPARAIELVFSSTPTSATVVGFRTVTVRPAGAPSPERSRPRATAARRLRRCLTPAPGNEFTIDAKHSVYRGTGGHGANASTRCASCTSAAVPSGHRHRTRDPSTHGTPAVVRPGVPSAMPSAPA